MAKRSNRTPVPTITKKQLSRHAKEEVARKRLYVGAGVFAFLIVGIILLGLYQELVAKPGRPVAKVGGVPIRTDKYEKMVSYRQVNLESSISQMQAQLQSLAASSSGQDFILQYYQQQIQYAQSQITSAPQDVLEELIDNELVLQESKRLGIAVSDEDLQLEIEKQFGYDANPPTATPTPITTTWPVTVTPTFTPTPMTQEAFQLRYAEVVKSLNDQLKFSEAEVRDLFRVDLYRQKLQEYLGNQLPTSELQVHARHILLATQEEADAALARLKAGEDFVAVAKELSTDETTKEEGGDLGWFPMGQMDLTFEQAAFATAPGQISEVIPTAYGFHIIQVVERDENRQLEPSVLDQKKYGVLDDWLAAMRYSAEVERILKFDTLASQ
jgi:foldase protein PrsA